MDNLTTFVKRAKNVLQEEVGSKKIALQILSSIPPLGMVSAINQEYLYTADELVGILNIHDDYCEQFKETLKEWVTGESSIRLLNDCYYSLPELVAGEWFIPRIGAYSHFYSAQQGESHE